MRWFTPTLIAALALPVAAVAQGGTQVALATYQGKAYDVMANCLMKEMRSGQISAWPLVYVPPRTEALVNLWTRGDEYGTPIGTFHIRQDSAGATTISFSEAQPGRLTTLARGAAARCS